MTPDFSRRALLRPVLSAPLLLALSVLRPTSAFAQEPAHECSSQEDESMKSTLNYLDVSPSGPAQDCRNCDFWRAGEVGSVCGACTLISGTISPVGYCDSWAPIGSSATPANAAAAPSSSANVQTAP